MFLMLNVRIRDLTHGESINFLIDFNRLSTSLGLFLAKKLGNRVHLKCSCSKVYRFNAILAAE